MKSNLQQPRLTAADVKARVHIGDVAALYRLETQPGGHQRLKCRCVCGQNTDRHPSFFLFEDDDHFHCFACNAHGDIFGLVQLIERCDFRTAFAKLREGFGLHASGQRIAPAPVKRQAITATPKDVSANVRNALSAATEWYQGCLWQNTAALAQLHNRGLSDATIRKLKLGYAPGEGLARAMFMQGIDPGLLMVAGLIHSEIGREHFRARLIFPVLEEDAVLFLIGRSTLPEQQPKYLGLPSRAAHKRPMQMGVAQDGSIITEGAVDFAALVEWGLHERYVCVGLLGTAHRSTLEQIMPHLAPPVLLALDQDLAGKRAALQLAQALRAKGIAVSIAHDLDRNTCQTACDETVTQTIIAEGFARPVHWSGAKDLGDLLADVHLGQSAFVQALSQPELKGGDGRSEIAIRKRTTDE